MSAEAIKDFLSKHLGSATEFELVQLGQKSSGGVAVYPAADLTDDKLDELVIEIAREAEQDAQALGGVNRYALVARFDAGKKPLRVVFRVTGDDENGFGVGGESEPATPEGLVAQTQRHTEALMRQCVSLTMAVAGHQNELIARQSETIMQMSAKHFESIQTIEELLSERSLREREEKRENARIEMRQTAFKEGIPLAKIVGAKLLTGGKIPAEKSPIVDAFKSWIKQLDPKKFERIMGELSPAEQAGILEIMTAATADEATEKEKATNGTNGHAVEPPADAGFH